MSCLHEDAALARGDMLTTVSHSDVRRVVHAYSTLEGGKLDTAGFLRRLGWRRGLIGGDEVDDVLLFVVFFFGFGGLFAFAEEVVNVVVAILYHEGRRCPLEAGAAPAPGC